ncbi:hypothetical protein [Alkalihalobacterium alkalinitrilicum]|uniref:hypothetical protein n=1 Tax=Alkalihalobacterium alkalinitrilicum TaxID=427920 RepID=UPI0015D5D4D4|nr:hypothetical protein [Alkalihalobacterium alkalinitrilicum]
MISCNGLPLKSKEFSNFNNFVSIATSAVPLVGALLIPVAIRAGLPPIGAAIAISLAGQGMALSSDYVIQIAPMLSSTAAGVEVSPVADKAFLLSIITGAVAITLAYIFIRKSIQRPSDKHLLVWGRTNSAVDDEGPEVKKQENSKYRMLFAVLVPLSFLIIIVYMVLAKFSSVIPSIEGGSGAALIGGAAAVLLIAATFFNNMKKALGNVSDNIVKGFLFIGSESYLPKY